MTALESIAALDVVFRDPLTAEQKRKLIQTWRRERRKQKKNLRF